MTADRCPYCKEPISRSLRFCIHCRHAITEGQSKALSTEQEGDQDQTALFKLSRKSYSIHREWRNFFLTSAFLLLLFTAYYFVMTFILHKPIPGLNELLNLLGWNS